MREQISQFVTYTSQVASVVMSDNKEPCSNSDIAANDFEQADDSTITLGEVLADHEEMEKQVEAVLGGSDDKFCTYSKVGLTSTN